MNLHKKSIVWISRVSLAAGLCLAAMVPAHASYVYNFDNQDSSFLGGHGDFQFTVPNLIPRPGNCMAHLSGSGRPG